MEDEVVARQTIQAFEVACFRHVKFVEHPCVYVTKFGALGFPSLCNPLGVGRQVVKPYRYLEFLVGVSNALYDTVDAGSAVVEFVDEEAA